MIGATRGALRGLRLRHGGGAVAAAVLVIGLATGAFAFWTTSGVGGGSASASGLNPPTGVAASASGGNVTVTWTAASPPTGTLTGYYVTRFAGATPSNACGTSPTMPVLLMSTAVSCVDTGVTSGTYTYRVTAVFRTWTAMSAASASVTVVADATAPTQVVSLTSGAGTAHLAGTTAYYRGDLSGSFTLSDAVTDTGSGPASATFPAIATAGWTHALAAPTTGTGSGSTRTYAGGTYDWTVGATSPGTHTVTGRDVQGNSVATNLTFTSDVTGPTGGTLSVAGTTATANGSFRQLAGNQSWPIVRTPFTADAGSGLAVTDHSVLTRAFAPSVGGTCPTYQAPVEIAATTDTAHTTAGCYRYTLTGTDRIGNTTVRTITMITFNDGTDPTQTVTASGNAYIAGSLLYYRSGVAGSMTLTSTVTDNQSGPGQANFANINTTNWLHLNEDVATGGGTSPTVSYTSSPYTWTAAAGTPTTGARTRVTVEDNDGNDSALTFTFTPDATAPTGGGLTVNGTAAAAAATSSSAFAGSYPVVRTDYSADLGSGLDSSVLTREYAVQVAGACTAVTYGAPETLVGAPAETGLPAGGCYRYTLTGTDRVGNETSVSTVVRVIPGSLSQAVTHTQVTGRSLLTGTTIYYNPAIAGSFTLTDTVTGVGSLPASADYPALTTTGWSGHAALQTATLPGGAGGTRVYTSNAFGYTNTAGVPGAYAVIGRNAAGMTVTTTLTFDADATGPTGGSLTVNGVAGTGAGAVGGVTGGTVPYSFVPYDTDTESGYASTTLTRATAPLTAGTCGAYGTATPVTGPQTGLAGGCYRYTLTGTDNVGNTSTLAVVVQVDAAAPTLALRDDDENGHLVGSQMYYRASGGTFRLIADVTDSGVGPGSVTFPALTGGFTHAADALSSVGPTPTATYTSTPFTWGSGATTPGTYTVTGRDLLSNATTASITTWTSDATGPTGGALTVNGIGASGPGTTSNYTYTAASPTVAIARTAFGTDTGSGVRSTELRVQHAPWNGTSCGTYDAMSDPIPTTTTSMSVWGAYCNKFSLIGTDNVGNETVISTVVRSLTLSIQSVTLTNGPNDSGVLNRDDTIAIRYTGPIATNTLCPGWTDSFASHSITANNVVTVSIRAGGGTANDYMLVSTNASACSGNFKFGTLTLGDDGYLTSTTIQNFGGTGGNASEIAYDPETFTLTVTLGYNITQPGVDGSNPVTANTVAVYSPNLGITGSPITSVSGIALTGTGSTANVRQF